MGKLAAVVYDAFNHTPLVVRTNAATPAQRFAVIDTITAFAHHCESLQGIAKNPAHISALWGGPPYITYQLVRSRYRAMVLWTDAPGDFDQSQDVQDALVRLHAAVASAADSLQAGDANALALPHAVAAAVLHDEHMSAVRASDSSSAQSKQQAKQPPKFLQGLFGGGRKSSASYDDSSSISDSASSNILSLSAETDASTVLSLDPESLASELNLPDELFAWSDFGAPLPHASGDIGWVANLIRGMEKPKVQPRPPERRDDAPAIQALDSPAVAETDPLPPSLANADPEHARPAIAAATAADRPIPEHQGEDDRSSASAVPPSTSSEIRSSVPSVTYHEPQGQTPLAPAAVLQAHDTASVAPSASTTSFPTTPSIVSSGGPPMQDPMRGGQFGAQTSQTRPVAVGAPIPPALLDQMGGNDFDVSAFGQLRDESATRLTKTPSAPTAATQGTVQQPSTNAASESIRAQMNRFANTMQEGNFALALEQVIAVLQLLANTQPRQDREIIACASYFQALKIMTRVRVLEAELTRVPPGSHEAMKRVVETALLTMFLAEMKTLLPRHSVAGKKLAVEKNILAGNFGMAARWLRTLIEMAPQAQKPALQQRLQSCVQNGELNASMPPTKYLCYATLQVIPEGAVLKCGLCPAVFYATRSGIRHGQRCPVCLIGAVAARQR